MMWNDTYEIIELDGKKGIADDEENIVVPCEYDEIEELNDCADRSDYESVDNCIYIEYQEESCFSRVRKGSLWGFLKEDEDGAPEFAVPCILDYDEVEYPFESDDDEYYYFMRVRKGSFLGIVNDRGEEIVPCRYDSISIYYAYDCDIDPFPNFIVSREGRKGVYNSIGGETVPCEYDEIIPDENFGTLSSFQMKKDGKWGAVGSLCVYDEILEYDNCIKPTNIPDHMIAPDLFAPVRKDKKWGLLCHGELVIPCIYDAVGLFDWNYNADVKLDGRWGCVNRKNETVIPFEYEEIRHAETDYYGVCQNEKWGVWDISENKLIVPCKYDNFLACNKSRYGDDTYAEDDDSVYDEVVFAGEDVLYMGDEKFSVEEAIFKETRSSCKYDSIWGFSEGFAAVELDGKWGFVNKQGEEVVPCKYDDVEEFSEGFAQVELNGKSGFVNEQGEEVVPCKYDDVEEFSEGFASVKLNGKWSFVNKQGEEVVPCKYDYVAGFSEGFASVELNGKWGLVNKQGEEVVPCKYDYVYTFSEGFAQVKLDGKWGFVNEQGEEVVPCKYDYVGYFSEGFAKVELDGKWGKVNTRGEEFWD